MSINIKISDINEKLIYNLNITDRVTIIRGNSATGKTVFVRLIDNIGKPSVKIKSPIKLFHLTSKMLEMGLPLSEDYIYVMDEGDGLEKEIVVEKLNNINYKFIIIARKEDINNFSYGIFQLYEFKNSGKYNKLVKKYDTNLNNRNIDKMLLNTIIT